jgi:hypothetical protein
MAQTKIQATANSDHAEYGMADIHTFTPQMILMNSLKKLGMFWGMAVISVFLPVVHFVLVPLFLILGVVFMIRARKYRYEITSGQVPCPRCQKEIVLGKAAFIEFHDEICQHCAGVARIRPVT